MPRTYCPVAGRRQSAGCQCQWLVVPPRFAFEEAAIFERQMPVKYAAVNGACRLQCQCDSKNIAGHFAHHGDRFSQNRAFDDAALADDDGGGANFSNERTLDHDMARIGERAIDGGPPRQGKCGNGRVLLNAHGTATGETRVASRHS